MSTKSNYQCAYVPTFCVKRSISSSAPYEQQSISCRRPTSFLPAAPGLRGKRDTRHSQRITNLQRHCLSAVVENVSSTQDSSREETPAYIICSVVHSAFEQAIVELMFPSRHDATFVKCYELVGAVLYAKRNHMSIKDLEQKLHCFSRSQRNSGLPLMSELQCHTVRSFLDKIYAVDDLLEAKNHVGIAKYTPKVHPSRLEYNRLRKVMKQGRLISEVLKEICECNIGTLRDMVSEKPPEVASRSSLPSRWANVLAVLTAYLREHIQAVEPRPS